jgi:hypothetical protein
MRWIITLVLAFMVFSLPAQQDEMLRGKKKQKRMWRRWSPRERKNKTAYNPYLKKKDKDKPSSQMNRGNKKEIRKQRREFKKNMRKGKRKTSR